MKKMLPNCSSFAFGERIATPGKLLQTAMLVILSAYLFVLRASAQTCSGIVKDIVSPGTRSSGIIEQWTVPAGGPIQNAMYVPACKSPAKEQV